MDPKLFKHTTLMTIMIVVMIKMMTTTMTDMSVDLVCESEAFTHSTM